MVRFSPRSRRPRPKGRPRAREALLTWVIDLAVERRRLVSVLQFDPVIIRLLAAHEPFQR